MAKWSSKRLDLPEDELREMYIDRKMSLTEIAEHYGVNHNSVKNYLEKFGIKRRDSSEGLRTEFGGTMCGEWQITHETRRTPGRHSHALRWKCICTRCGTEAWVLSSALASGRSTACRECGYRKLRKGHEEISSTYWRTLIRGAAARELAFEITIEYAWNLFIQQERKCALSGMELVFTVKKTRGSASLDRIDSSLGYVIGNVQWVHKDINNMKWDYPEEYFIQLCHLVVQNHASPDNLPKVSESEASSCHANESILHDGSPSTT